MNRKPSIELQSIIDAQDNPFVLIDENYNIVSANRNYCEAYGISPDDIIGKKCHMVSHRSDVPCHQNGEDCPHKQVFATWKPHQVLHIHYDKDNKPDRVRIKGSPVMGADGKRYLGEAVFRLGQSDEIDCNEQRMIGKAPAFLAFVEQLTRAAETDASVKLVGESGVGKDMAAQFIHKKSSRMGMPFMQINCSTIDHDMFESELFGHEKGAINGCVGRRFGMFESADGGTLFINEIDELPFSIQGKLIRALESGSYRRVGGQETLQVDVRVICSTSGNLLSMVEAGTFRADLYYRIAGIKILIPPLRERRQDIPALCAAILTRLSSANSKQGSLTVAAQEKLMEHDFPGNLHELKNILQQALIVSTNGVITPEMLNFETIGDGSSRNNQASRHGASMREIEAQHIADLLARHGGHRRKVADEMGISERTLYRKLDKYDLNNFGK